MRKLILAAAILLMLTACPPPAPQPPTEAKPIPKAEPSGPITATIRPLEWRVEGVTAFAFADAQHGWLAAGSRIMTTADGGQHWLPQFDAGEPVLHLDFISPARGWASTQTRVLTTADGGKSWAPLPGKAMIRADFVDERHGWAVTEGQGLSATADGGQSWQKLPLECTTRGRSLRAFSLISPTAGFALCTGQPGAGMQPKELFRTHDGGQSWEPFADLGKGGYGSALFFLDEAQGWYGMSRGSVLRTADGGATWGGLRGLGSGEHFIGGIQFLSPEHGFIIDNYGGRPTLLLTRDGGNAFEPLFPTPAPMPWQMIDAQTWVAAGTELDPGAILRSEDGGTTWRQAGSITGFRVNGLSFADRLNGYAAVEEWSGSPQRRQLMRTADGGATWSVVRETPTDYKELFLYLSFVDPNTGFAGSGWGHLWATTDGGKTWTQIDGTDKNGQNFDFVSPQRGWKTREFTLEATEDGGRAWKPVGLQSRVISFDLLPDGTAWVNGGQIESGGHKSQLFVTHDWGRSWSPVDLGGMQVGQIRFADAQHGIINSDSGRLFTTSDGGKSWTQVR